jgi:hypothetical protein
LVRATISRDGQKRSLQDVNSTVWRALAVVHPGNGALD